MDRSGHRWRRWVLALIGILLGIVLIASALPLAGSKAWWVRYTEFPRLQLAVALIILLPAFVAIRGRVGTVGWSVFALVLIAVGYHAVKLYPYSPLAAPVAVSVDACPPDSVLTVMVANVKERNEFAAEFLHLVAETDPDVLLNSRDRCLVGPKPEASRGRLPGARSAHP